MKAFPHLSHFGFLFLSVGWVTMLIRLPGKQVSSFPWTNAQKIKMGGKNTKAPETKLIKVQGIFVLECHFLHLS